MIFTESELQDITRCMDLFLSKRRPAENMRHESDLQYRIKGHDIDIYELHATDDSKKSKMVEHPSIKITYVEDTKQWTLYAQTLNGTSIKMTPFLLSASPCALSIAMNLAASSAKFSAQEQSRIDATSLKYKICK